MPDRITKGRERLILARAFLELARIGHKAHLSKRRLGTSFDYLFVYTCVFIGHMEGRAMSAAKIAAYIDLPRSTVLRRLGELVTSGTITQQGTVFYLRPEETNTASTLDLALQARRIFETTFEQLSILNTMRLLNDRRVAHKRCGITRATGSCRKGVDSSNNEKKSSK